MVNKEKLFQEIKNFYDSGFGYHTLKFPDGSILKGEYDMSKYLDYYQIPKDLSGKTVLEIGPANGFFSFEFCKRGAKEVIAIDKHDEKWNEKINQLMNTDVKFVIKDMRTLDESFGKFDIVFCSHVLQHAIDLYDNIRRIREVTKHKAILCTAIEEIPHVEHVPLARFIGDLKTDKFGKLRATYWHPNMECFKMMAQTAGFKVKEISTFTIKPEDKPGKVLSGVIHCDV